MLILSITWVALAAAVTVIAIMKKAAVDQDNGEVQVKEPGKPVTVLAVIYGLALLGGFVYVSWHHGLELIK